jgi:hypothetical protein
VGVSELRRDRHRRVRLLPIRYGGSARHQPALFPQFTPLTGTLAACATFAVGFFARPVGGVAFGHFGGGIGRKCILLISLLIMGGVTFLVGLLPTFQAIGNVAPVLRFYNSGTSVACAAEQLVAEMIRLHKLPTPLEWIEHWTKESTDGGEETFDVAVFSSYEFTESAPHLGETRVWVGDATWERLYRPTVEALVGAKLWLSERTICMPDASYREFVEVQQ